MTEFDPVGAAAAFAAEVAGGGGSARGSEAVFRFEGGLLRQGQLRVARFTGREAVSKLYHFDVELAADGVDLTTLEATLLGHPASLDLSLPGHAPRTVHGIVAAVALEGVFAGLELPRLRVRLVPRLWRLTRNRTSRVFQNLSVQAIVTAVLNDSRVASEWRLSQRYQDRVYCVQYEESDWDFVQRLCAEEGIFFYFEHPAAMVSELGRAVTGAVGAAVGAAAAALGGVLGEAAGSLASVLDGGERVVFADRAVFYPPIGGGAADDGAARGSAAASAALDLVRRTGVLDAAPELTALAGSASGLGGSPRLELRDEEGLAPEEHHVTAFGVTRTLKPKRALVADYDFTRPRLDLRAEAAHGVLAGVASQDLGAAVRQGVTDAVGALRSRGLPLDAASVPVTFDTTHMRRYDHHGTDEAPDVSGAKALVQLEQHRARAAVGRGRSFCRRLTPGHRFTLENHATEGVNREYVVTQVRHEGRSAWAREAVSPGAVGAHAWLYRNSFACAPSGVTVRPPRPPRTVRQVVESAVVVGPAGEEIHTDAHGRIKVQFHWDLAGRRNEHSSCWVRVSQAWSGASWGFQFIPRIGMEVLVSFLGGDQDRPVVVGCLPNGENLMPFELPAHKTRAGVVTRSTPGGAGHNELSFEDAAGVEQVRLRAQRDLDARVLHDATVDVGHDVTARVGGNVDATVGGNLRLTLTGDRAAVVTGQCSTYVARDQEASVMGCRRELVGEHLALTVEGSRVETVRGDHRETVSGRRHELVEGDASRVVRGRSDVQVAGDSAVAYAGGHRVEVAGDHAVRVGEHMRIEVAGGLTFVCGDSSIELRPDEILLRATRVRTEGTERVTVRGADSLLRLGDELVLRTPRATIQSRSATLTLDDDATLGGGHVRLCSTAGARASGSDAERASPPAPRHWVVRVTAPTSGHPREAEPCRNQRFRVVGHGPEPFEGQTDGDGVMRIPVVYERCTLDVTFEHFTLRLRAGDLDDAATEDGVRQRLHNLGYRASAPEAWTRQEFEDVVRRFQRAHGLPVTGAVDAPTRAAVQQAHD